MNQTFTKLIQGGLIALLLVFSFSISAQNISAYASFNSIQKLPTEQENFLLDREQWKEIVSERKPFSSTYLTPDKRTIIHFSKAPLNYYDARGLLQPIDARLQPSENGWSALNQPLPTYLFQDGSAAVSTSEGSIISFSKNCKINGKDFQNLKFQVYKDSATITDSELGIDKKYEFRAGSVKYSYVIKQPLKSASSGLVISEEMLIPDGYVFTRDGDDEQLSMDGNGGWKGDLILHSPSGKQVARFFAPLCFDANNKQTIAAYSTRIKDGKKIMEIVLPNSWLNDAGRRYPVTIDPLVTGDSAKWAGGMIPSCIYPSFSKDSLLVKIPAGITVTNFLVSANFTAKNSNMIQGKMAFSTSCGRTGNFTTDTSTVDGLIKAYKPGETSGADLEMQSPLLCCFPQSCQERSFYLRYLLSRDASLGTGCNSDYIYYNPLGSKTFSAYVVGNTVEAYGDEWKVTPTTICSNACDISGQVFPKFGVPPYTITHTWAHDTIVIGNPKGCNNSAVRPVLALTIPNCNKTCDPATSLSVPAPVVKDACGNIAIVPSKSISLIPATVITASPTSVTTICTGDEVKIELLSCMGGDITWNGDNISGTGNITDKPLYVGLKDTILSFTAKVVANQCSSSLTIPVTIQNCNVVAPNILTPNGDGINEVLVFNYLGKDIPNTLKLFNRWGQPVYEKENYSNDWNASVLSSGTYYYILTVKDHIYKGFVQVIR